MLQKTSSASAKASAAPARTAKVVVARRVPRAPRAADTMGFKTMRNGVKEAADETLLSPR
jgi:hypothetical protein